MPEQFHTTAQYDTTNGTKRDLMVLVTGFGDFGNIHDNPATAVASALNGVRHSVVNKWGTTVSVQIVGVGEVPVNFQDDSPDHRDKDADIQRYLRTIASGNKEAINKIPGPQFVAAKIETTHPDIVISLGVDSGETMIRVEKEAHNIIRMDYAANNGNYHPAATAPRHDFVDKGKMPGDQKVEAYLHDGDTFETLKARLPVKEIVDAIGRKGIPCHDGSDPGKYVCENVMWEVLHEIDHPRSGCHILRGGFIHLPLANTNRPVNKMVDCILEAVLETAKVIREDEW